MAPTPETLTRELRDALGRNLESVILYGSAASGDHHARYSDYNILVILRRSDPATYGRLGPLLRAWTRAGNPLPQLMTRLFLARSADVFPIEWADMREHHRVLHGADVLRGLTTRARELRLELERELKAKLLRLHAAYAAVADQDGPTRELLIRSSSTFLVLFRSVLRLRGVTALPARPEVAAATGKLLRMDLGVFALIERMKAGDRGATGTPVRGIAHRYVRAIEAVVAKVDSFPAGRGRRPGRRALIKRRSVR